MDKNRTIFEDNRLLLTEPFEERLINPDGIGIEHHTFVSACEIPEEKVFWVIADAHKKRPHLFGTEDSFKAAEEKVLAALKNKRAICRNPNFAFEEYVEQKVEQVTFQSQDAGFAETTKLEFVYEKFGFCKYLIKKKASSELVVYGVRYSDKFKPAPDTPVFKLNKRELDNTGETKARGQIFCTEEKKMELDKFKKAPHYLKIFGLDWSAEVSDVKYWFRKLSKEYHPDLGGNVKKFRELIECYEKAIKSINARNERDGFI
ncbi:hypothetical protein [Flexithrix dorotheae]|uniref:hypothetical protein n=1 Tax=Flexithrix dorotheae TaxID=70993 RepID=UPI0003798465|nr:hypothetical protein [Flexithrix dorotheae]